MSHVRGPFIEYECSKCGRTVQENADYPRDRLIERIVEVNTKPETRLCAAHPADLTEEAIIEAAITLHTMVITSDNLPSGPRWEQDGACWRAGQCTLTDGWRWFPMNMKAFAKGSPQGDMTDHAPFHPTKPGGTQSSP